MAPVVVVALLVLSACGQRPGIHPAAGAAHLGGLDDALPAECEGDAAHCVVLTSFQGVNVYENVGPGGFCTRDATCRYPRNRYGSRWQCVELFNRFFALRFGTGHVPGHAADLLTNAASVPGLEVHTNGGQRRPVPGDALVFEGGDYGHVAIVVAVSDGAIHVIEQNGRGDGTNRYGYDAATNRVTTGAGSPLRPLGWIHATVNTVGATH